jgi:hypothetical protein
MNSGWRLIKTKPTFQANRLNVGLQKTATQPTRLRGFDNGAVEVLEDRGAHAFSDLNQ